MLLFMTFGFIQLSIKHKDTGSDFNSTLKYNLSKTKLKQVSDYFHVRLADACSAFLIQHLTLTLSPTTAYEGFHS